MQKALADLPVLDQDSLRTQTAEWRKVLANAGPGGNRIVIEWSTGRGPSCFLFPAGWRGDGFHLVKSAEHPTSDERWADFFEFDFVPQVAAALKADGYTAQVVCVDLRPLQVQRARRRALEAVAHAKTGGPAH